jgi:hypothetical protein
MPYSTPPRARQLEHGRFNRFLATLPQHDFSLVVSRICGRLPSKARINGTVERKTGTRQSYKENRGG